MVDREAIYELVKARGPSVPSDITGHLNVNTILVGAFLSELHAHNKIGITTLKRGGSPFYYALEQIDKLQYLRDFLGESLVELGVRFHSLGDGLLGLCGNRFGFGFIRAEILDCFFKLLAVSDIDLCCEKFNTASINILV